MDLRLLMARPTATEISAVDAVVGAAPTSEPTVSMLEAKRRRPLLLPALISLQRRVGHISKGGMGYACERLGVPPAEAFGVASFYALLSLGERPAAFAHVCDDIACLAAGAEALCKSVEKTLGPSAGHAHRAEPNAHGQPTHARWAKSPCLGLCEQAPAAMVTLASDAPRELAFGHASVAKLQRALSGGHVSAVPLHIGGEGPRKLLARAGKVNPESLEDYQKHGGFTALARARQLGAAAVIAEVSGAKLVGRGGAAFPTGRKWDAVAKATGSPKYVVCNADESEPGTFKDRVLLELDPFAVVEAMCIAGFATGANKGFIYIRGEYPLAVERVENAVRASAAAGILKGFELEVRRGAGAYICGEETALFASIEGFRGEPRSKPPFPVHQGLFGKPTAINNVETLVATLDIVRDGAAAYAEVGTAGSPGTKLFCVSGNVAKPGIYEVPFGMRLDALIALAGGVPSGPSTGSGRTVAGVLLGGAAGTFLNPSQLGVQLSFEHTREAGTTLGSGVVFVLDDSVELLPLLRRIAEFFRDESCGQCIPCRVGTVRQEELLARLARGAPLKSRDAEAALYAELSQAMKDASICGLGQTASSAIESAFKNLPVIS